LHNGAISIMDPQIAIGGVHIVQIINIKGGTRCIARLRMGSGESGPENGEGKLLVQREVDCMELVRERTSVQVPKIYAYISNRQNEDISIEQWGCEILEHQKRWGAEGSGHSREGDGLFVWLEVFGGERVKVLHDMKTGRYGFHLS
jgi:hypothetical protein